MRTVYLVGAPGSGKTTALAAATSDWTIVAEHDKPVPHVEYDLGRAQLGRRRPGGFGGTDALAMNIQPRAVEWVYGRPARLLVAEGDRLANRGFLDACRVAGRVDLVWLDVSPAVARARALGRAQALNVKPQTEGWWRGRVTKVSRLVGGHPHHRIDGDAPFAQVVEALREILSKE